jgi:hypothetical protein
MTMPIKQPCPFSSMNVKSQPVSPDF